MKLRKSDKKDSSSFEKIFKNFEERIDHYEKELFDAKQLLQVVRSLCGTIDLKSTMSSLQDIILAQVRATGDGIFSFDKPGDEENLYLNKNVNGLVLNPKIEYKISKNSRLVQLLNETKENVWSIHQLKKALPRCNEVKILASLDPTLIVPLTFKNRFLGILVIGERINFTSESVVDYTPEEIQQIKYITSFAAISFNNAYLMEQSTTDMMTKLKLKHYFFTRLDNALDNCMVRAEKLAVIMFDIDFFKKINDNNSHECGDYVLITVANLISNNIRTTKDDLACRYGGEEFTVYLPDTDKEEALLIANRIREEVEKYNFKYENKIIKVTISGGVSVYDYETNKVEDGKILVHQADMALYYSKENGRNQITYATKELIDSMESKHGTQKAL